MKGVAVRGVLGGAEETPTCVMCRAAVKKKAKKAKR